MLSRLHLPADPAWRALWAAMLGYMLDAMDVLLYVFALQTLRAVFGLSHAQAGLVSSATLVCSAVGGALAGVLADRMGRRRLLIYTILLYSLASGGTASATSFESLLFWRALVGFGLGGEWSAGAVLVAEWWPAEKRGRAIGFMQSGWALGYMLAAVVTALVLPRWGWRVLFLTGVLPALLTLWIRRRVEEPEIWRQQKGPRGRIADLFRAPLRRRTLLATALTTSVLLAYWGLFTWLPGFLSAPPTEGGAGMSIVRTSAWMVALQAGAFAGYLSFGWLADRFGRRPAFVGYMLAAAALTPLYGQLPALLGESAETGLLVLGPFVGFFGSGYFSLFGALLAELYPTPVRGAGQGLTYNAGRAVSALAPYAVGFLADRAGVGSALALSSAFFLAGALLILLLPETKARRLEEVV
ncbi:MAG: MFS transporter [Bryobacterales bacterium]|nr:MFS transporter [Bryobacteraceae bacterium]MDW8355841.1 MFS transporter [Bryobacterales bacterium]